MRRAALTASAVNCLLAPVPAAHLPDAIEIAAKGGAVAFGSNAFDTLRRLKDAGAEGATPVFIAVSHTGFDPSDPRQQKLKVGKVQFQGVLHRIVEAKNGRHPDPSMRPASTRTDTGAGLFWEVVDLRRLEPVLTIGLFSTASGKAWQSLPEGPVEAHLG